MPKHLMRFALLRWCETQNNQVRTITAYAKMYIDNLGCATAAGVSASMRLFGCKLGEPKQYFEMYLRCCTKAIKFIFEFNPNKCAIII